MDIPAGKVTFLFTDIEGSTRLAQKNTDTYNSSLNIHNDIFHEVIESNNGFVFKIIGDAFCCSFSDPLDAVRAAVNAQVRLNSADWNGTVIKVRMGIHSGDAEYINNDYSGYVTLCRVQRIMSIAYGGQIFLTQEVYDAVKGINENGLSFRNFGERKLKDLILPEHVYQLVSENFPSDFPPIKGNEARQNNLPLSVSNFIGRRKELQIIKNLFSKTRLMSLTGSGGTGKTRIAIQLVSEILDEFQHGCRIIELSPITDPELIVKEISGVLNLKEIPETDILETLKDYLKDKNILLLFDNSEHLLTRCAPLAETLLNSCPDLKIISTSRQPFNIHGETVYKVPPLSIPDRIKEESFDALCEYESVRLFNDRAASVNSEFRLTKENINSVAELCKKLDGIPLAIELAAKRTNVLTVERIYERLTDRFKLLTGGSSTALPRQRTLRAMIDWSYDMLNFKEQLLLQRLSVFMGGWTLEAAEEICSDKNIDSYEVLDIMNSLLDKSLIVVNELNGNERYGILETIKFYALEKLTDKLNDYQKHFEYFLMLSDFPEQKKKGISQIEWLKITESEIDNIRICITRALEDNYRDAAKIVINVIEFWILRGYFREGFETTMKLIDKVPLTDKKIRADLLLKMAQFCYVLGKFPELEIFNKEALNLYREIKDKKGIADSLNNLGIKSNAESDPDTAAGFFEEALSIGYEINSDQIKLFTLYNLSFTANKTSEYDRSIALKEEALSISRKLQNDYVTAQILLSLSVNYYRIKNDFSKAAVFSEESLALSRNIEDQYILSLNLINLGVIKMFGGNCNYVEAEYILQEAYKISAENGYTMNIFPARILLGALYIDTNRFEYAVNIYKEYLNEWKTASGEFYIKDLISGFTRIYIRNNEFIKAAKLSGFLASVSGNKKFSSLNIKLNLKESEVNVISKELGEDFFRVNFNEGKELRLDEVIDSIKTDGAEFKSGVL